MNACSCCGKPFGRVRTTIEALSWNEQFCSRPCADQGRKVRQQQERVFQFLRAVGSAPPSA